MNGTAGAVTALAVALGPTDVAARLIAQKLSENLKQQFFIENQGGAGGNAAGGGLYLNAGSVTIKGARMPLNNAASREAAAASSAPMTIRTASAARSSSRLGTFSPAAWTRSLA